MEPMTQACSPACSPALLSLWGVLHARGLRASVSMVRSAENTRTLLPHTPATHDGKWESETSWYVLCQVRAALTIRWIFCVL